MVIYLASVHRGATACESAITSIKFLIKRAPTLKTQSSTCAHRCDSFGSEALPENTFN